MSAAAGRGRPARTGAFGAVAALVVAAALGACSGLPQPSAGSSGASDAASGAGSPGVSTDGGAARPTPDARTDPGTIAASPAVRQWPAILAANPSRACLEAIEGVAERASGSRVLLGPAAFASSDELVLERTLVRGPDGRPLDGRMRAPGPVVLRLSGGPDGCAVRQVPAVAAPVASGALAEAPAAVVVTEPVVLPQCRCLRAPD